MSFFPLVLTSPFLFFSLSSDDEVDEDDTNEKKGPQKEEEGDEEDDEEEMERKLAELKAEEVADLKRFVMHWFFSQLHLSQIKLVHPCFVKVRLLAGWKFTSTCSAPSERRGSC